MLGQGPPSPQRVLRFTYEHKQSKGYTSQTLFTRRTPQAGTRNPDTCALVDPALRPKNTNRNFTELGRDSLSQVHQGPPDPGACQPPIPQFSRAGTPSPPLVLSGPQQQLRKPQCPQPRSTRKLGPKRQSNPREPITAKAPTSSHPPKVIGRQVTQQVLQQDPVRSKHATSALQPLRQNSPWETETLIPAAVLRTTSAHPSHRVIPTAWDTLLFATCHRRTRT